MFTDFYAEKTPWFSFNIFRMKNKERNTIKVNFTYLLYVNFYVFL